MPALGNVSHNVDGGPVEGSLDQPSPSWPDISTAIPDETVTPPASGGFPGYFSFS